MYSYTFELLHESDNLAEDRLLFRQICRMQRAHLRQNAAEIRSIYIIHNQSLLGPVAYTRADYPADFLKQGSLVRGLPVVVENQFENIVQIDFLRLQQVYLKYDIVPVQF